MMKKRIKRILAGVMSLSLLITMTGCGGTNQTKTKTDDTNGENTSAAMGRYVEKELTKPEDLTTLNNLTFLDNGDLAYVNIETGDLNVSNDGGMTWQQKELPELAEIVKNPYNEILMTKVAGDGSIFYGYNEWPEDTGTEEEQEVEADYKFPQHFFYMKEGQSAEELGLAIDDGNQCLMDAVITEDGRIFGMDYANVVYEINLENKTASQLFSMEASMQCNLSTDGKNLFGVAEDKFYRYDLENNSLDSSDTVLNQFIKEEVSKGSYPVVTGKDDSIYLATGSGLYAHVYGGNMMEQLLDGGLCSLGMPNAVPQVLLMDELNAFYVAYADGTIDSYTYDPDVAAVPSTQLEVFSIENNDMVRQTISMFRQDNPDVFVKYEVGVSGEDGKSVNDAIQALNTSILAGEGPDVILLDQMPMESYLEKGMLLDLTDMLKQCTDKEKYFENILYAYREETGTFAVPVHFQIPIMTGNTSSLQSITDLASLAEEAEKISKTGESDTVLGTYTAQELMHKLVPICGNAWLDESGNVDEAALTEFLTLSRRIYQAEQKNLTQAKKKIHEDTVTYEATDGYVSADSVFDQLFAALNNRLSIGMFSLRSVDDLQVIGTLLSELPDTSYTVQKGQDENVFLPSGIVGINAQSDSVELAKAFVEKMLSTEVQQVNLVWDGFAVNRTAFEALEVGNPDMSYAVGANDDSGNSRIFTLTWPSEQAWDTLEQMVEGLSTPSLMDQTIADAVQTEGAMVLDGEKEVEAGVQEIMQKIQLYLAE